MDLTTGSGGPSATRSSRRFFSTKAILALPRNIRSRRSPPRNVLASRIAVSLIHFTIEGHHAAIGRYRIRFQGAAVAFVQREASAQPQGFVCLMIAQAGSSNSLTNCQAASRSTRLL